MRQMISESYNHLSLNTQKVCKKIEKIMTDPFEEDYYDDDFSIGNDIGAFIVDIKTKN